MSSFKYLLILLFLVNSVKCLYLLTDVTQPTCSNSYGSISFEIQGAVGVVNIVWTPVFGNVTHVENLSPGLYHYDVTDDSGTLYSSSSIIAYTPLSIVETGTYRSDHHYSSVYLEMGCAHSTVESYYGGPHGYGYSNVTKNVPRSVSGGYPPYTYLWSAPYGSFDDPTQLQPIYYPDQPLTLFDLTLQVTDSVGCVEYSTIPYVLQQLDAIIETAPASFGQNDGTMNFTFTGRYDDGPGMSAFLLQIMASSYNFNTSILYSLPSSYPLNAPSFGFQDFVPAGMYRLHYNFGPLYGICWGEINYTVANKLTFSAPLPNYVTFTSVIDVISDGTGPFTYSWSPTVGLNHPNQENPGFFGTTVRTYTLTVTDANGVSGSMTTIYNPMILTGYDGDGFIDINSAGGYVYTFDLDVNFGAEPYVYSWSPAGAVSNSVILNPDIIIPVGTSQLLQLYITDATGYTITYQVTATNYIPNIVSFDVVKTCDSYTGGLSNIIISGTPHQHWQIKSWSSGLPILSGMGATISDQNDLVPGNYSLSLPNDYGYPTSVPEQFFQIVDDGVKVNPATLDYCSDDIITIDTIQTGLSYLWSTSDPEVTILSSTTLQPQIQTLATSATLDLTITSSTCTSVRSIPVTFGRHTATITITHMLCGDIVPTGSIQVLANICSWDDSSSTDCQRDNLTKGLYTVNYVDSCGMKRSQTVEVLDPEDVDSDGDGVPDCRDPCPFILNVDHDNDGVPSCVDLCDTNCQTVGICPNITEIPTLPVEDIGVTSTISGLNIFFNVTAYDKNDTVANVGVDQLVLPLQEIDEDYNIIQSIDLTTLHWYQNLVKYDGYRLLTSFAVTILDDAPVAITWFNYFIDGYCFRNLTCSQNMTSADMLGPGDSKIAFHISGWPFRSQTHRLRTTFKYNITDKFTKTIKTIQSDTEETFQYHLDDGFILAATYLRQCLINNVEQDVNMTLVDIGEVDIIFPYFSETLSYDPMLSFLFTGRSVVNYKSWTRFEGPIIAASACVFLGILIIVVAYKTKIGQDVILGPEYRRLVDLRKNSSDIEGIEQRQHSYEENAKREFQRDIESDTSISSGDSEQPITTAAW